MVSTATAGAISILIHDGRQQAVWDCDRGAIKSGQLQHVVITVDGGPKIITFTVDGQLCDGGEQRQFGWGRFSPTLRTPVGAQALQVGKQVQTLRIYNRPLRTSEAIGNYRAGVL